MLRRLSPAGLALAVAIVLPLATVAAPAHAAVPTPIKVLTIVEENHAEGAALLGMPWLASMARSYGYARSWQAVTHPSLPNYLALAGGSSYAVTNDAGPAAHPIGGSSVFGQALSHGKTAKTYAEGMSVNCGTTGTSRYAVKHNPWAYFASGAERPNCRRWDVPAGTTTAGNLRHDIDAGTLPTVGLLVPDLCHDAHDCSLGTADSWLRSWLAVVMRGPDYRAGRLAIVVTFDEDDTSGPNTVLTVVISPRTAHVVSSAAFSHYSWTRYAAELSGTSPLRAAATARSIRSTFHI